MNRSLINSIRDMWIAEDAGVSGDPVAANSDGAGRVAGLGVPNPEVVGQVEPGGRRRRRKTAMDRRLLKTLTPVGRERFYSEQLAEAGNNKVVEVHPVLPKDPKELSPHLASPKSKPKKRKIRLKDGGVIKIHPKLPHKHFEDVVDEDRAGGTPRIDMLVRLGLGDVKKILVLPRGDPRP